MNKNCPSETACEKHFVQKQDVRSTSRTTSAELAYCYWLNIIFRSAVLIGRLRGPRREPTCIDGWMDGWMDGRMDGVLFEAQKTMFFGNISKNKKYFFLIVFAPPRRVFKTSFVKISDVLKIYTFFKIFRTTFFSEIFSIFWGL